jgi:hypothetical protein
LLVQTDTAELFGVTSDGYAIYAAAVGMTESLWAASITGGANQTPKKIIDFDSSLGGSIAVSGTVVLVWPGVSTKDVGSLSVWTAASGVHSLTALSYTGTFGISDDSKYVMYMAGVPDTATSGQLWVAGSDGSSPHQLLPNPIVLGDSCLPIAGFAGDTVVASYCPAAAATDGGAADGGAADGGAGGGTAVLSVFGGASWTEVDIVPDLPLQGAAVCGTGVSCALWVADKAGKYAYATSSSGAITGYSLPSGTPTISVDNVGTSAPSIEPFTDGSGIVYTTSTKSLKYSPIPTPSPKTLVTSGATAFPTAALSADNKWAIYYTDINSTNGFSNLYLASTTTPGTPVTLSSTMNALTFGQNFTTDSTYATFYANATSLPPPMGSTTSAGFVGTLTSIPVAGGTPTAIGQNVWANLSGAGSTVIFQNNYIANGQSNVFVTGTADVYSVPAAGGTPTLIVSTADATGTGGPLLDSAKANLIYTYSSSGAAAGDAGSADAGPDLNGVYVVPVP